MATRETRRLRGRRRGAALTARALSELKIKREFLGVRRSRPRQGPPGAGQAVRRDSFARMANMAEVLLPNIGDRRSWDRVLRLLTTPGQVVGVDLETRIRDIQALVRRTGERERDGGVDEILIVLSNSATNRSLVDELRTALGTRYATWPRRILAALRSGKSIHGSGIVLI